MIDRWKRARLAGGEHVQGYGTTNILHPEHGVGAPLPAPELGSTDFQKVQTVVDSMHPGMRAVFEAWELGLIRGDNARRYSQRARCLILGLSWSTYKDRHDCAVRYIQMHVEP